MQHAFGPHGDDSPRCAHGRGARSVALTQLVLIRGGVVVLPESVAGAGIKAFDDLTVADSVKENQAFAGDDRAAISFTHRLVPEHRRAVLGPGFQEAVFLGD